MTIRKLASLLALKEGKKKQARIGEVRELLKLLCEMEADAQTDEESPVVAINIQVGKIVHRRAKKVKRAK